MSTGPDPTELVELLRALGNLTINVNVTHAPGTSTSSGASSRPEAAPAVSSAALDPALLRRPTVFGPWDPRATPATCPASVTCLARHLRGTVNGQDPLQRIESAYALGREAQLIYAGDEQYFTARPRTRKACYVVLCGRNVDEPFYTTSAYLYSATVQTEAGRNFDPTSISHGFGSIAEAEAFCRGAGLQGLPTRRD